MTTHLHLRQLPALVMAGALVTFALAPMAASAASRTALPAVLPAAVPAAAPVGKLVPSGCTSGAGAAACDLYAAVGTTTFLGQILPIWGFASSAVGPATAPGPQLVVNQGDVVTVTLHNAIPGESVSLSLPGQSGVSVDGAATVGDDMTGLGNTGTRSYTFTAGTPGTFLYQAGHTANGTRQVAMGLAGALVVLPTSGGPVYDDDAVLVLSELDPALNAAPGTFDMRNYDPRYRLINGKPFPETNVVSTDQGHKVRLRYVNVGALTHSMSVLGAVQAKFAEDGHVLAFTATVVAERVAAGQTMDTLVTMPTGPEAKVAVYDAGTRLSNNGQTTADPKVLAFGGMLSFLDTAAPPPSLDQVGPVSSTITATPNPSNGLADVTVTADVSDATTGGSTVTAAEFVIDDAVTIGPGFGAPMTGAFGTVSVTGVSGVISQATLTALEAGQHVIYVRALDSAGNWGVINSVVFNLPKTGPLTINGSIQDVPTNGQQSIVVYATGDDRAAGGTITDAEYFIDNPNPAVDLRGTAMTRNRVASVVSESAGLSAAQVNALADGLHTIHVRSKNSLGLWGPTLGIDLPVDKQGPVVDGATAGPNPSNGILSDTGNPGYVVVSAAITDAPSTPGLLQSPLVDAEGFIDPVGTPAGGTGFQLVAVDGAFDSTSEAVTGLIPISQIRALANGPHTIAVRGQDAADTWGPLFTFNLTIDKVAPVLGALTATPNPSAGTALLSAPFTEVHTSVNAAEYWFGATDPSIGKATSVAVSFPSAGTVNAEISVLGIPAGTQTVNLRVRDAAGNWSVKATTTFTVTPPLPPNPIFSDDFQSGNVAAWSGGVTGAARLVVNAAAGIPAGAPNVGLQVTESSASRGASYIADNTPTNEATYHAQFALNLNTLTPGSATVTVFQGRTASAQAFAVQIRRNGGNNQIRIVLNRTTGGTSTGGWATLTPNTAAHTIRIDWASATAPDGLLRLTTDGTVRTTLTGNTSSLKLDTVRLGLVAGVVNSTTGVAWFDTFVSTRNTL